jgi:hypothetical protein
MLTTGTPVSGMEKPAVRGLERGLIADLADILGMHFSRN